MPNQPTCTWTGKSGTAYKYEIYPLPVTFNPNQSGNYIFSKKNDKGLWVPLDKSEGVVKRHFFTAMLGSTA